MERRLLLATYSGPSSAVLVEDLAKRSTGRGRVQVMTGLACKGLEFDGVVVLGADEGEMPSWLSKTPAEVAEERRKFYVAVTRARDSVLLIYSGFTVAKSGWQNIRGPSRFLSEMKLV